ncbi:hypothetical protein C1I98_37100 [Spongiactinospora gelatinilytica]|uniref:DUF3105 domain-containing protein n=1 Tax=Spongiactinospora gelatinilytica TaxID=2666298 RepID=A0A2W2F921_9ACTN|nr:DUF3105 domain-containing protein [Spongiactinospora gelatinilytica]PZG21448.1 hypothetical protein C1I98_37100 [Spongiactinospora gelatinilytica]
MSKEKAQARREHLAQMRAAQKRKERRTAMLMWGAGGLVIILLVGVVAFYLIRERSATSLGEVVTAKYPASQHKETKISYKENPPLGGEHNSVWQRCGIYDEPVNNEHAVHSLEHGAIWITYNPTLPKAQVETLKKLAGEEYMLLSPYPGLPSPIVASAWNNQIKLSSADDPKLPRFISKYRNNPTNTPEFGASCEGPYSTDKTAAQKEIPAVAPSGSPDTMGTPPATSEPSAPATGTPEPSAS